MRFYYCDLGLISNMGHHANSARAIVSELRKRNIDTTVLAHKDVSKEIQDELQAKPFFTYFTYNNDKAHNEISGWLTSFLVGSELIVNDLMKIEYSESDNIFYFNSINPTTLWGISQWMMEFVAKGFAVPKVITEFGVDPGLDIEACGDGKVKTSVRNPIGDSRSVLYNFIGANLPEHVLSNLFMCTFEEGCSDGFQAIIQRPISTLPVPRSYNGSLRCRNSSSNIHVSFLGHQRGDKGYQYVPEIIKGIKDENIKFLIHNGGKDMQDIQEEIRNLAKEDNRIIIDETEADDKYWQKLLDMSDLIVCPYVSDRFVFSYSSIVCEAIANGIPLVVPANTSLERQVREYEGGWASFICPTDDEFITSNICSCIRLVLADFYNDAEASYKAALKWKETQGSEKTVDKMLEMIKD